MMPKSLADHEPRAGSALPAGFYERDPREVARDLLGCVLASWADGVLTGGVIVETEAYLGSDDPGSHAATRGITKRNAVMYGPPGTAYVYFTYGNHHMLNVVCEPDGTAAGVLIRALDPTIGLETMQTRRGGRTGRELCAGPGRLTQALGVTLDDNGVTLGEGRLQVYAGMRPDPGKVTVTGRIGLREGGELPYRYHLSDNIHVSRGAASPVPSGVRAGATRGKAGQ